MLLLGFRGSLTTKFVSLDNQWWRTRPTLIDVNPHELYYYPFIVNIDRHDRSSNNNEDAFCRICVPSETENTNLKVFNMIKRINESKY